jgi:hypothetical protein
MRRRSFIASLPLAAAGALSSIKVAEDSPSSQLGRSLSS